MNNNKNKERSRKVNVVTPPDTDTDMTYEKKRKINKQEEEVTVRPQQQTVLFGGVYLGKRDHTFKNHILGLLKQAKIKDKIIEILSSQESLEMYADAFTSETVDKYRNYQVYEQLGDLSCNKFIVRYIYSKFPQLRCADGVKVAARLRINYGASNSFAKMAEEYGFWEFISAPVEMRRREKKALLEDVFEAFFGVTEIILDDKIKNGVGYACVYKILDYMFNRIDISLRYEDLYDSKTRLKELADYHTDVGAIIYEETWENRLIVSCVYQTETSVRPGTKKILLGRGSATNKIDAQQIAATNALAALAQKGIVKRVPAIYTRFLTATTSAAATDTAAMTDTKMTDTKSTVVPQSVIRNEIFRLCGGSTDKQKINEVIQARGKTKFQNKYSSTVLAVFARRRSLDGIRMCMELGSDPSIPDSTGLSLLDLLFMGSVDETVMTPIAEFLCEFPIARYTIRQIVYEERYKNYKASSIYGKLKKKLVVMQEDIKM